MVSNLCKVQVTPCENSIPGIMEYVKARLKSMRVDSCTKEFKECLQSEDRCGEDYTQCIGLDTDTIVHMCPADKLVGCQDATHNADYVYLEQVAQGIFLNIDNNMLTACQRAADAAMIKVCGSTENCDDLITDDTIGAKTLEYKICKFQGSTETDDLSISYNDCVTDVSQIKDTQLGRIEGTQEAKLGEIDKLAGVIDGKISWESIDFDANGNIDIMSYWKEYDANGEVISEPDKKDINAELSVLAKNIQLAIDTVESDQKVQYCRTGRKFQGMNNEMLGVRSTKEPRFPQLTAQMRRTIANSAIKTAKDNYYNRYDELNKKMLQDYVTIGERIAANLGENKKDARREIARKACVNFAEMSAMAVSSEPPKSSGGVLLGAATLIAGAITANPGLIVSGIVFTSVASSSDSTANGATGNTFSEENEGTGDDRKLTGSKEVNQWNYKETITTTFDWENLVCHKCVRSTPCAETKNPVIGNKYCETWGEETEICTDTQF